MNTTGNSRYALRMSGPTSCLSLHNLSVTVPGRCLVDSLDAEFVPGEFVAILGQNGAGKSVTLQTMAGLRPPDSGTVQLGSQPLDAQQRRSVAQRLALLPQSADTSFPGQVMDTVLIGRHPHIGALQLPSADDRAIARRALEDVDLGSLAERDIGSLSGGELRRVTIAQCLAQTPDIYLLDEPSNHLDPRHQLSVASLFARKVREGATVIAVLHDINLAQRLADRVLLLYGDGRWRLGASREVMNDENLSELFDVAIETVPWQESQLFVAAGLKAPAR